MPGWQRLADTIAPERLSGRFLIANRRGGREIYFEGDVSSFVDRQMYLYGHYEGDHIDAFLALIPAHRREVLLDVGANVGTHSLVFARAFHRVHAFEPNPRLWMSFQRNLELNGLTNVILHERGLGDTDAQLRFFSIRKNNFGLGTFCTVEQYDLPLEHTDTARVVVGDFYLPASGIDRVDVIKLDVQGFESEALAGLRQTLRLHQPFVWFEVGPVTRQKLSSFAVLRDVFPYPFELLRFTRGAGLRLSPVSLQPAGEAALTDGDYVVAPRERPHAC